MRINYNKKSPTSHFIATSGKVITFKNPGGTPVLSILFVLPLRVIETPLVPVAVEALLSDFVRFLSRLQITKSHTSPVMTDHGCSGMIATARTSTRIPSVCSPNPQSSISLLWQILAMDISPQQIENMLVMLEHPFHKHNLSSQEMNIFRGLMMPPSTSHTKITNNLLTVVMWILIFSTTAATGTHARHCVTITLQGIETILVLEWCNELLALFTPSLLFLPIQFSSFGQ
ncbi:MAG: hypothetical protein HY226_04495 [Candidatus Vogelbacteria bacterium]|nr:hypothetical protein [Candidatus Vogelbacteria bacterium]